MAGLEHDSDWWKEAVVYQVYPRSFNDTDGDGVGDLQGVIEKLDYLDELGVDVVWLNPVYESPNADNGYDIADYRSIMDEFGTMADWEDLLDGLHERGIALIMDLVVNHTSDEHEWFVQSRDPESEYRDWYWWREGVDADEVDWDTEEGPEGEAPPNDWGSFFGGPAWAYDDETEEWYLHLFDRKQPDLNWENTDVREEVFDMMQWWLEKGIDGFRMDVINLISKVEADAPDDAIPEHYFNGPRIHEYIQEMNEEVLEGENLLTVGEMIGDEMAMETARQYVGENGDGLSMIFHFEHMLLDRGHNIWEREELDLTEFKAVFDRWQHGLADDGWNSLYLNNHDQPRMVSRFGNDDEYRRESAKLLGTLLHTLQGTPYIYQGEELGMTNYPFESLDDYQDVDTVNPVQNAIDDGRIDSFEAVADDVRQNSRDNARTPMQWSDDEHAGFTDGEPWMQVNPNHEHINAEAEREDPDSVFHYYRALIDLRKEHDVVVYGEYDQLTPDHEELWAYTRTHGDEQLFVALNFSDSSTTMDVSESVDLGDDEATLLLGNYGQREEPADADALASLDLRPWEARVYRLEN
ncbi:alpha-glucosidase [Haloarchaeobius sp. HME9146]|uniref:glycoside hydrolase family 13 protein n=1 Tax=Haloarchaeobius sp. HME9146 TaxID=2978732 RepID=UPI0021BEB4DD|nr:alpha-glucosidase [Haloarchaeobius sp. HME9146]MCT9098122.1 alpha-glucosidase [Haloarchaeobius sp. HME9146]